MSWNKNTIDQSNVDSTIKVLKNLKVPYELEILGDVAGHGLNDDIDSDIVRTYPLRKLQYSGHVLLEQMERTCDCDFDDYLTSADFPLSEEPKNYPLEVFTCVCGYDCYNINQEESERSVWL